MRKAIALLLAVLMAVSCTCIAASAEKIRDYGGGGYLSFGDSFTRGMYASDTWADEVYTIESVEEGKKNVNCRNVHGSYTYQLAEAFGCVMPDNIEDKSGTYWPTAQFGATLSYVLDLLGIEDNYFDTDFREYFQIVDTRYESSLYYFGDPLSVNATGDGVYGKTGTAGSARALIEKAEVITVALGMSDVFNTPLKIIPKKFLNNIDVSNPVKLAAAISDSVDYIYGRYNYFIDSFPLLLDYLQEHATGDVVIIGSMNPINGVYLTDNALLPIGNALSIVSNLMNKNMKEWCEEYGFLFVDTTNVELGGSQNEVSVQQVFAGSDDIFETIANFSRAGDIMGESTHPTPAGYAQIYREVLHVLDEKHNVLDMDKTDIRVDLGRLDHVNSVVLDGKNVTDFTVTDSVLVINNDTTTAKSLTVTSTGTDGKLSVATYRLSFDSSSGYTAYRTYISNNIFSIFSKTGNRFTTIFNKIADFFKNLFRKNDTL